MLQHIMEEQGLQQHGKVHNKDKGLLFVITCILRSLWVVAIVLYIYKPSQRRILQKLLK